MLKLESCAYNPMNLFPGSLKIQSFKSSRRPSRRGFSLLEVMIVVLIIAVGTTMALYNYANFRNSLSVDTSSSMIRRMMIQAKNRSINNGVPHELVIDLDTDNVWINELTLLGVDSRPRIVPNERVHQDITIGQVKVNGVPFETGIQTVRFEPDGTNPLVVVQIRRLSDNGALDESYTSIRLYPNSSEPQVENGRRL